MLLRHTSRLNLSLRPVYRHSTRHYASAASDPPLTHAQKTASDPRSNDTQSASITAISQPTKTVRLIDFRTQEPFKFKAGQWVDLFTPDSEQAGGFSLVSAPSLGLSQNAFRLAIQQAPRNPPAAFLWRPIDDLVNRETVRVRVGGQFTFPPVNFRKLGGKVRQVTLIAGGIGSNPMLSILGALQDARAPLAVTMLYGIRSAEEGIFLDELHGFCDSLKLDLRLFVSQSAETQGLPGTVHQRRFEKRDLDDMMQGDKDGNLYYICGPAQMTDFVQEYLLKQGVPQELVQTERWW